MTKHQKTEPKAPSLTAAIAATKPEPSALDARSIDELLAEPDTEPTPETPIAMCRKPAARTPLASA